MYKIITAALLIVTGMFFLPGCKILSPEPKTGTDHFQTYVGEEIPDGGNLEGRVSVGTDSKKEIDSIKVKFDVVDYDEYSTCLEITLESPTGIREKVGDDSQGFPIEKVFHSEFAGQEENGVWKATITDECGYGYSEGKWNSFEMWIYWKKE